MKAFDVFVSPATQANTDGMKPFRMDLCGRCNRSRIFWRL